MANKRTHSRGGKGSRKYGRNEIKCQIYRSQHKREKSHIKRITKHISKHPKDKQAKKALLVWQRKI